MRCLGNRRRPSRREKPLTCPWNRHFRRSRPSVRPDPRGALPKRSTNSTVILKRVIVLLSQSESLNRIPPSRPLAHTSANRRNPLNPLSLPPGLIPLSRRSPHGLLPNFLQGLLCSWSANVRPLSPRTSERPLRGNGDTHHPLKRVSLCPSLLSEAGSTGVIVLPKRRSCRYHEPPLPSLKNERTLHPPAFHALRKARDGPKVLKDWKISAPPKMSGGRRFRPVPRRPRILVLRGNPQTHFLLETTQGRPNE